VSFSPYSAWFCSSDLGISIEGLYYGLYGYVYIVNAATFDLTDFGDSGELNDTIDAKDQHSTPCGFSRPVTTAWA